MCVNGAGEKVTKEKWFVLSKVAVLVSGNEYCP